MIDLLDIAGRQTDLVSVGAVAVRSLTRQRLLRKLAFQRLRYRTRRVGGTGHTHRLIYIGTS